MDILLRYLKKACNALLSFVGVTQVSYKQVKWNMHVFQHTKVLQEKQPIAHSARAGQTETRVTLRRQETEMSGLSAGPLYTLLKISSNRHAGHFSWIHQSQRQGAELTSARLCDWLKVISFAPAQAVRTWLECCEERHAITRE